MIIKKRFSKRKFGVMSEALTEDMGKKASFTENLSTGKNLDHSNEFILNN